MVSDKYFQYDWTTPNFETWVSLLSLRHDRIEDILEIGSWEGRSAIFWLEFFPHCDLTCIDDFSGGKTASADIIAYAANARKNFIVNTKSFGQRVRLIEKNSAAALADVANADKKFDLIYVDGSHLYDDVLTDSELSWPLLRQGGILIWDDYLLRLHLPISERPQAAIDIFLKRHSGNFLELFRGNQIIIERTG